MEEKNGIDKLCCEPSGGCSGCLLLIFIIFIITLIYFTITSV